MGHKLDKIFQLSADGKFVAVVVRVYQNVKEKKHIWCEFGFIINKGFIHIYLM